MLKIYVSYKEVDEAIPVSKKLMDHGYLPFIPRLNKLITDRSDDEWIRYYSAWLYSCDCIWATPSARKHELEVARNFGLHVVKNIIEVEAIQLPAYEELCKEFSKFIAVKLESTDPKEEWRTRELADAIDDFEKTVGRGSPDRIYQRTRAIEIAAQALKVWDLTK